jgi:hypothetical protein
MGPIGCPETSEIAITHCVTAQKSAVFVYFTAEVCNHLWIWLFNPLTPELNPSAQRCLMRFFTGDFASWTVHFVNICVKTQQIHQVSIQLALTCFGITLPSSGSVPSACWEMLSWRAVDRILWMGVLCLVMWCFSRTTSLDTTLHYERTH